MTVLVGDCRELMARMEAGSADAIVCDPPYELNFMAREWDRRGVAFDPETWRAVLRVLRPGGHLLAFGGTRTYHRMTCAIEDAGFEIRDSILAWGYGSGFPKSMDVSKQIDDTEVSREWSGWGTALKPGFEPVVVARKPFAGTVAGNVLAHGTGALNIDGCRVEGTPRATGTVNEHAESGVNGIFGSDARTMRQQDYDARLPSGRWPANVILIHAEGCVRAGTRKVRTSNPAGSDGVIRSKGNQVYGARDEAASQDTNYADADGLEEMEAWECVEGCPVRTLDEQSGELQPDRHKPGKEYALNDGGLAPSSYAHGAWRPKWDDPNARPNSGGASRFFYSAKAARGEREAGLLGKVPCGRCGELDSTEHEIDGAKGSCIRNDHPTVKPIDVMRWLVRLVTPPGGLVLDPFVGSGTTGAAAALEGMRFVGCEQDVRNARIAETRIVFWEAGGEGALIELRAAEAKAATGVKRRAAVKEIGQLDLLAG